MAYNAVTDSGCDIAGTHVFRLLRDGMSGYTHVFYCIHCLKFVDKSENSAVN